ncbi:MAG: TrmH family RNA methyltransferase [Patescibacteria group bacterium]
MVIVLDNIRSAWNVGAIMRTCDAVGAKLILLGYTPKPEGSTLKLIKKTAIGAEDTVEWESYDHYCQVFSKYSDKTHLAIEIADNCTSIFDYLHQISNTSDALDISNIFLWFGNEIHGLEQSLLEKTDRVLFLPMQGSKESLNVASCVCTCTYLFRYALFKGSINK